MPMFTFLVAAAVAQDNPQSPSECDLSAFCATHNGTNWACNDDPTACDESDSVMLHMRRAVVVGSAEPTMCIDTSMCPSGDECIARQCRTAPGTGDARAGFVAASAVCAALGPAFVADVTHGASPSVECTTGNATQDAYAESAFAHTCALCVGFAARMWRSSVVYTKHLGCRVEPYGGYPVDDSMNCSKIYGSNLFLARETLLEAEPVADDYLLVGMLPTNESAQLMPFTITPPLFRTNGERLFDQTPVQLMDWDEDLRATASNRSHDQHLDLDRVWRFVYFSTRDGNYGERMFGLEGHTSVQGRSIGAMVPDKLCTVLPAFRVEGQTVQLDPYCCKNGDFGSAGCFDLHEDSYGINHFFVRGASVCGVLSRIQLPVFGTGKAREIPPFSDFLLAPQRWLPGVRGRATDQSVRDVDRTAWNDGAPCRPPQVDLCYRRDRGVTVNGRCVYACGTGYCTHADVCVENGTVVDDCAGLSPEIETTSAPEIIERPRCNSTAECTVAAAGCYTQYVQGHRSPETAVYAVTFPPSLRSSQLCGHLCDISRFCSAHSMPLYGDTCYLWGGLDFTLYYGDTVGTCDVTGFQTRRAFMPIIGFNYTVSSCCNADMCYSGSPCDVAFTATPETFDGALMGDYRCCYTSVSGAALCKNFGDALNESSCTETGETWCSKNGGPNSNDGMPVLVKAAHFNGCFDVTYDADVSAVLSTATTVRHSDLNRCYATCEALNCTELVYSAPTNLCALAMPGDDSFAPDVVSGTGNGLHAVRSNASCVCPPVPTVPPAATTSSSTNTLRGLSEPFGFFGRAVIANSGAFACGPDAKWLCPVYRHCHDAEANCSPWRLTAEGSNVEMYFNPSELPQCVETSGECNAFTEYNVIATSSTAPDEPTEIAYAQVPDATRAPMSESQLVEVVIASVIGGCGILLILAGFWYRHRTRA